MDTGFFVHYYRRRLRPICAPLRGMVGCVWRISRVCFGLVWGLCWCLPGWAQPLPELVQAALGSDPALVGAQAQVRAAQARVVQARAAYGPTVVLTASQNDTQYRAREEERMRLFGGNQVGLQLSQPVVRPALYSQFAQAELQLEQAQAQLGQVQMEATQRVVEACFDVLKARDALSLTSAQQVATAQQLAAAQRSFTVGTVPITDVREAQAKADTVAAQQLAAQVELDLRQQMLVVLVGLPVQGLMERGLTGERLPRLEGVSVLEWLDAASAQSAALRLAQVALRVAQEEARKAHFAHAPTVDLTYSVTRNADTATVTSIAPRLARTTQVGLSMTVPLFASGGTQAKVRETAALVDKAHSEVDVARRTLVLAVRQGFSATLSALGQAQGLAAAVASGETALRANRRGYEVGMRVNADVLEAQSRWFEAQREVSKARYDAWINFTKLKATAGRLEAADVVELDQVLVRMPAPVLQPGSVRLRKGAT
jgi:outer membrane protein